MRIYRVRQIRGYYLGRFIEANWTTKPPGIEPTPPVDLRGIEAVILHEYWDYLWRLGEWSFSGSYTPYGSPPTGYINLENFVSYNYLKLWPTFGRFWSAVGAAYWSVPTQAIMQRKVGFPLNLEVEKRSNRFVFMRYLEELWWGRMLYMGRDGRWYIQIMGYLGRYLMFERRGPGVAKRFQDQWNFGMTYWEIRDVDGRKHLYLWGDADVTYLGLATKLLAGIYSVKELLP